MGWWICQQFFLQRMVWKLVQQWLLACQFFQQQQRLYHRLCARFQQQWLHLLLCACFQQQQWLHLWLCACFQQQQRLLACQLFQQRLLSCEQLIQRLVLIPSRAFGSLEKAIDEVARRSAFGRIVSSLSQPPVMVRMQRSITSIFPRSSLLYVTLFSLLILSCGGPATTEQKNDESSRLAGTWTLKTRIKDGVGSPVTQRLMRLVLKENGTFHADYKGEESQRWIRAGQGGFSYNPPLLQFYWDKGPVVTLLVVEAEPARLLVHHGRNLVPLKNQEPDEVFVGETPQKGPTRKPA